MQNYSIKSHNVHTPSHPQRCVSSCEQASLTLCQSPFLFLPEVFAQGNGPWNGFDGIKLYIKTNTYFTAIDGLIDGALSSFPQRRSLSETVIWRIMARLVSEGRVVHLSCYDFEWFLLEVSVGVFMCFQSTFSLYHAHKGALNCHMLCIGSSLKTYSLFSLLLTATNAWKTHWRMTRNAAATISWTHSQLTWWQARTGEDRVECGSHLFLSMQLLF